VALLEGPSFGRGTLGLIPEIALGEDPVEDRALLGEGDGVARVNAQVVRRYTGLVEEDFPLLGLP
jgi:hypothetical protein